MNRTFVAGALALVIAVALPLAAFGQVVPVKSPELLLGAGIEGGITGIMVQPSAEVKFPLYPFALAIRGGASAGTLQGQDLYITASARAYLGWLYGELGASWRAIGLPAAGSGELLLPAQGVWPMGYVGLSIPAGQNLRISPQIGMHFTDMKFTASGGGGSIIGVIFAVPVLYALGGIRAGLNVEYSL